jgi:hypothetical protein
LYYYNDCIFVRSSLFARNREFVMSMSFQNFLIYVKRVQDVETSTTARPNRETMATAPDGMESSAGGTYKRRKFVTKFGGQRKNLNLDNVQQALEEDSSAVEMLRRDVVTFQEMELDTSRKYLASLRKSYDKLRNEAVRARAIDRSDSLRFWRRGARRGDGRAGALTRGTCERRASASAPPADALAAQMGIAPLAERVCGAGARGGADVSRGGRCLCRDEV